jgi:hypothetical protein
MNGKDRSDALSLNGRLTVYCTAGFYRECEQEGGRKVDEKGVLVLGEREQDRSAVDVERGERRVVQRDYIMNEKERSVNSTSTLPLPVPPPLPPRC